jgi:hypothetical protein
VKVAIANCEIQNSSEWRDRSTASILARASINLHDLKEGELVEGWFCLGPGESQRNGSKVELAPDAGQRWTPPWERYAYISCMHVCARVTTVWHIHSLVTSLLRCLIRRFGVFWGEIRSFWISC